MAQLSNNSAPDNSPQAVAAVIARARLLMVIAGATTLVAIAAVVAVIGYRVANNSGPGIAGIGSDSVVILPKGARVLSTVASGGRVAVLIEINGLSEMRVFDIKTLKETGRLRFATEP